jgi:hypothetical protein
LIPLVLAFLCMRLCVCVCDMDMRTLLCRRSKMTLLS